MELQVTFWIPAEITDKLNALGIPDKKQENAIYEAIYLHIQERFLVDEEEEIIQHVVDYDGD